MPKICLPHVWEEYGFSESCIRKRDSLSLGRRQGRSMENSINHPYEYRLYHGPEGIYYLYYDQNNTFLKKITEQLTSIDLKSISENRLNDFIKS